nr:hypothetical protein Iba_scaffold14744CG0020 [Ipomoea batatas]
MVYFILQLNGTIEPRTLLSKGVMSLLTNSVSSFLKLRMKTPLIALLTKSIFIAYLPMIIPIQGTT